VPFYGVAMAKIGIYKHHPFCSEDSALGVSMAMDNFHTCKYFDETDISPSFLRQFDLIVFPGGIGDSDEFANLIHWRKALAVNQYVEDGGRYLGICMGAYWAGSHYFDILRGIDVVQYIKRPMAEINRSYATVAEIEWLGQKEEMFFYDGAVVVGGGRYDTIAKYKNDEPMAVIQGNVGIIGCHPESDKYWYDCWNYMPPKWHERRHWKLLRDFVKKLLVP
jgi:imidazoleglycerol phosphate synthase glutamine amidotransferase subunit HisH